MRKGGCAHQPQLETKYQESGYNPHDRLSDLPLHAHVAQSHIVYFHFRRV